MQLIDFKKYDNNIKKKKLNRKKVVILTVVSVIVAILIIMSLIYIYNKDFRNIIDTYVLRKEVEENNGPIIELSSQIDSNNIIAYDRYVGILDKSILNIYSSNGKKDKELEVEISNCIYDSENRFLVMAEKDGQKITFISGTDIVWKNTVEGTISNIFVNENGYVSVITKGTTYNNVVIIYNPDGTELFKSFLSKTMAVDAEISNDNKYLAIAEIDTSGSFVQSNVKILSMEKAQTDPENSTEYIYPAESDEILIALEYQDNDKLICMYDDSIHVIENNTDTKLVDISDNKNTFADIGLDNHIVEVVEKSSGLFADVDVEITEINTNKKSMYTVESAINSLKAKSNVIAINLGTEIHFIDTNGWLIKKYNSTMEAKDILLGTNNAAIVFSDKIEIVNI